MRVTAASALFLLVLSGAPAAADARSDAKKQVEFGIAVAQRGLWREAIYRWLSYASYDSLIPTLARTTPFAGIREGQVWRIITPAFMHAQLWGGGGGFGMFHVIFNMWWMKDLGGMLERVQGGRFMLVFVLVVAAISNTAQYVWDGVLYGWGVGPGFVGMCGVVLGVYCYMWARSKLDYATPSASHGPFAMYGIERREERRERYVAVVWTIEVVWPQGEITFESPGFEQRAWGAEVLSDQQHLAAAERRPA